MSIKVVVTFSLLHMLSQRVRIFDNILIAVAKYLILKYVQIFSLNYIVIGNVSKFANPSSHWVLILKDYFSKFTCGIWYLKLDQVMEDLLD